MQPSHQPQSLLQPRARQCCPLQQDPASSCLCLPWVHTISSSAIRANRQPPRVSQPTHLLVPWHSSVFLLPLLTPPAVLASGLWLFIFFTFLCTCFLFLPAVSTPLFAITTVVLDSCRTSGTEDKTRRTERHFMMCIYCHKIFCMAVTSRFSQTVCALRLFLTLAANSSLTGFIILHYSQQARSLCHMLSSPAKANHVPMLAADQGWLKPAPFLHAICFERIGDGLHVRCSSVSYHTLCSLSAAQTSKQLENQGSWYGLDLGFF